MSHKIGFEGYKHENSVGFFGKENSKDGKDGKEGKDDICPVASQVHHLIEL